MADKSSRIKINRWVRMWNRYKGSIITLGLVVIVGIVVLIALQITQKGNNNGESENYAHGQEESTGKLINPGGIVNASSDENPSTNQSTEASTQGSSQGSSQPSSQPSTQPAPNGNVLTVTSKAAKETYTSAAFYSGAIVAGDGIASGFTFYNHLAQSQYVGDSNMSVARASTLTSKIVAAKPTKIILMMGINDLNYNNKTASQIATAYSEFIASLKTQLPSVPIYIVSVLPVGKTTVAGNVTNARIKEFNDNLALVAKNLNVKFVNIYNAFTDSNGYLSAEVSGNGLNISAAYYPYLLNAIAGVAQ